MDHSGLYTDPLERIHRLKRNGISQAEIARSVTPPVTPKMVNLVIYNQTASHRVRMAVAQAMGVDIRLVWPDPYLTHGGPRKPGRPRSATT